MLQSIIGTIDVQGLRSLRPEPDHDMWMVSSNESVAGTIWAVLDSADLVTVRVALRTGQKRRALQLLSESARSLGPVLD